MQRASGLFAGVSLGKDDSLVVDTERVAGICDCGTACWLYGECGVCGSVVLSPIFVGGELFWAPCDVGRLSSCCASTLVQRVLEGKTDERNKSVRRKKRGGNPR